MDFALIAWYRNNLIGEILWKKDILGKAMWEKLSYKLQSYSKHQQNADAWDIEISWNFQ